MVEEDLDGLAADSSRIQADDGLHAAEAALQGKLSQRTGDEAVQQQLAAHKDGTVVLDLEEPASGTRPVYGQEEEKQQLQAATAPSQHEEIAEAPKPQENVLEGAEEQLDGLLVEPSVTQALDETALLNLQEEEQLQAVVGPSPRVERTPQAPPAQASDPGLLDETREKMLDDPQVTATPLLAMSSCPSTQAPPYRYP